MNTARRWWVHGFLCSASFISASSLGAGNAHSSKADANAQNLIPAVRRPQIHNASRLCLSGELGLAVGDLNTKLLRAGDDGNSVLGRDGVGNPVYLLVACGEKPEFFQGILLGGVGLVVHEEEVEVTGVVDEEGLVAGGHHVAGLLVGSVANL
jgi:hypothetical protein